MDNNKTAVEINDTQPPLKKPVESKNAQVIKNFNKNIKQNVIESLFSYFGRTYYDIDRQDDKLLSFVKNEYQDEKKRRTMLMILKAKKSRGIFLFIAFTLMCFAIAFACLGSGYDFSLALDDKSINSTFFDGVTPMLFWTYWGIAGFFTVIFIIAAALYLVVGSSAKQLRKIYEQNLNDWNIAFEAFSKSLDRKLIDDAIQAGIAKLEFDRYTPSYDKRIYSLHERIYIYANIPRDAHMIEFENKISGFYGKNPFIMSYSQWEWFRESDRADSWYDDKQKSLLIDEKRKLQRFTDEILVLAIDVASNPELNFILYNYEGKNINLSDTEFNTLFSLAVNNKEIAQKELNDHVQNVYIALKKWSPISNTIRQVIKEGEKMYVIMDGRADFFEFDRITDPAKNIVFNTSSSYGKKDFKIGSLDETATLMTEFILDQVDVLFTALEFTDVLPIDEKVAQERVKREEEIQRIRDANSATLFDRLQRNDKILAQGAPAQGEQLTYFERAMESIHKMDASRTVPAWNATEPPKFNATQVIDIANHNQIVSSDTYAQQ